MAEALLSIDQPVRLESIERYILQVHGDVRNLTPEEHDVLVVYANLIIGYIQDRWPVDTGTSRDEWRFVGSLGLPGAVGFRIINDMWYARWVHRSGEPAGPPLWEILVPAAIQDVAPGMLAALRAAIDRTEAALRRKLEQGFIPPLSIEDGLQIRPARNLLTAVARMVGAG